MTAFTGVEGKSYGPFTKGEQTVIPKEDRESLIGKRLASYTAPTAPEIMTVPMELKTSVGPLSGQTGTLTAAAIVKGVNIIVLAIALMLTARIK